MKYKLIKIINPKIKITIRNFLIFNKLRIGANIVRIKPSKLLIKNRGYLLIFVQKSFIKCSKVSFFIIYYINFYYFMVASILSGC